jgi:hypothetical protein
MVIKNLIPKSITIKNEYILSPIDKKIIKSIKMSINNSIYKNSYKFKYKSQKYTLEYILAHILYIIKFSISWRSIGINIYNNIYKHYIKLNNINIFKNTYIELMNKYLKKTKNKTLKYCYTDTTFIINKRGIDFKERNKFMKNKYCNKLSLIVDNKFIPIDIKIYKGNINDSNVLQRQVKYIKKYMNHINYFICDKGYCSSIIRNIFKNNNITPIIPFNNRNTKNKNKIKKLTQTEKDKYKRRIKIEHIFGNLKILNKFGVRYEKYIKNYEGLIYLYFIKKICSI